MRATLGPIIARLNRDLIAAIAKGNFDLVWFEKALFVWPKTVRAIPKFGARTIHYNPDNPFSPRRDPGWRILLKAIPEYDAHALANPASIPQHKAAGARKVLNHEVGRVTFLDVFASVRILLSCGDCWLACGL